MKRAEIVDSRHIVFHTTHLIFGIVIPPFDIKIYDTKTIYLFYMVCQMKILLLDNIRSILNVGALFRTCDGAGFEKIILTGFTPTPPRREITKTAIGAENFVVWEYYKDPVEVARNLQSHGYKIFVLEQTSESIDFHEIADMKYENICLILGNEIE